MVSFWNYNDYELIPAFTSQQLRRHLRRLRRPDCRALLRHAVKTYLSTLKFCLLAWVITLVLGFAVAYFLAFHVRSPAMQTLLFVLCTDPVLDLAT